MASHNAVPAAFIPLSTTIYDTFQCSIFAPSTVRVASAIHYHPAKRGKKNEDRTWETYAPQTKVHISQHSTAANYRLCSTKHFLNVQ